MTKAEIALWSKIKNSQLCGYKFRRQHSVGAYILDFYCPKAFLAIELDGSSHDTDQKYISDNNRTSYLNMLGIKVIRFENAAVIINIETILNEIKKHLLDATTPVMPLA